MSNKRHKGDGTVWRRGGVWWIQYRNRGKRVREPGGFDGLGARTKTEAEEKLRQRLAEIRLDCYTGPAAERITVADLLESYLADLKTRGKHSVRSVRSRCKNHLLPAFGHVRAVDLTTSALRSFAEDRSDYGLAPASVNRCLQDLRAAFNLARKEERLTRVPHFPLFREDNTRQGFFERSEHEAMKAELPDPYRDTAEFAYLTGWRRGEIEPLAWSDVDRETGTVSLWTSKNGEPRTFPLRDADCDLTDVGALIERRWKARTFKTKDGPAVSAFVFHVAGRRVWDGDDVWRKARAAAKLPGRVFHDYRRTTVRDLVRAGVPESIAMSITGHKTGAVFQRYNITSPADMQEAVLKLAAYRSARPSTPKVVSLVGHSLDTKLKTRKKGGP